MANNDTNYKIDALQAIDDMIKKMENYANHLRNHEIGLAELRRNDAHLREMYYKMNVELIRGNYDNVVHEFNRAKMVG